VSPTLLNGVESARSRAIVHAADRIRVNAVAPWWIATLPTTSLRERESRSRSILARTPMRFTGDPADVAGAAV